VNIHFNFIILGYVWENILHKKTEPFSKALFFLCKILILFKPKLF
jgi:hypothetical protein